MKYTTEQLIEGIKSLMDLEMRESAILAKIQAAIQERKQEIMSALGVNVFEGITPETQVIRNQIAQYILSTHAREENILTACPETQAALDRVEELKRRYTSEQIAEMRKLRAKVAEILIESTKVDKHDIEKVLKKHGITQYKGRKIHGDPIAFIRDMKNGYARLLEVLFKAEVRRINKTLVDTLREVLRFSSEKDPLMTENQYTEMVAAGIFGDEKQQHVAIAIINRRKVQHELAKVLQQ